MRARHNSVEFAGSFCITRANPRTTVASHKMGKIRLADNA